MARCLVWTSLDLHPAMTARLNLCPETSNTNMLRRTELSPLSPAILRKNSYRPPPPDNPVVPCWYVPVHLHLHNLAEVPDRRFFPFSILQSLPAYAIRFHRRDRHADGEHLRPSPTELVLAPLPRLALRPISPLGRHYRPNRL
ncbi:hypothetical protein LZ30DRAFT_318030 [Colletotrichum cereale]|nr:hypothetical protein LZ30DRAFT_318030 [Colletotrichum cereale]